MTKREKLIDLLQEMDISKLIDIHNTYCYEISDYDNEIFNMDDLDEICNGQSAFWVACRVYYGDFNPYDDYLKFNGYGNFKSMSKYEAGQEIDENEIVDYILDNNHDLYNSDICAILEEE